MKSLTRKKPGRKSMRITEKFLTVNPYSRSGYSRQDTLAVVVHWVANPGQSAIAVRDYFESLKKGTLVDGVHRYASTQYIIDLTGEIIRTMPENEIAYHCGSSGKFDPASGKEYTDLSRKLFGVKYTNHPYSPSYATIGIEFCHPDWTGKYLSQTLDASKELIVDIFSRYPSLKNPMEQIIMHKEVVGWKECPKWFCDNPKDFEAYKKDIARMLT